MGKFIDLTGLKFNRLTVISRDTDYKGKGTKWLCICSCGKHCSISAPHLKSGHTKSCGCLQVELTVERFKTHGLSSTRLYKQYKDMKARCYNKQRHDFKYYGGRGIKVCDRWLESFENFLEDMGEPSQGFTLDRVNPNLDYTPENCSWASRVVQAINRRNHPKNTSRVAGVSFNKFSNKWIANITINGKIKHLGSFTTVEEAIKARYDAEDIHENATDYINKRKLNMN